MTEMAEMAKPSILSFFKILQKCFCEFSVLSITLFLYLYQGSSQALIIKLTINMKNNT